ncbi:hypothetical protein [Blastochloris viridis]|uniref:Uncharacterized protein n=1 Tax=Blastochloris viridis TaxID=1079 RepID=A0A0H5B897_BLAVI|nr:hypothetical protein [Blastochloris viridis]ALK08330.1 hypothetical protein BVIR_533 [Blastochloris viridis]BAR98400.1 hypothetical protein BV133_807 [Blastochloris viridis]CUU44252.1 hypothetical protein BVIRIDIS_33000 [Blastochloris viridis]
MPFVFISLQALIIGVATFDLIGALVNVAELGSRTFLRHAVLDGGVIVLSVANIYFILKVLNARYADHIRLEIMYFSQLLCLGALVFLLRHFQHSLDFEAGTLTYESGRLGGAVTVWLGYSAAMAACLAAIWKLWTKSRWVAQRFER